MKNKTLTFVMLLAGASAHAQTMIVSPMADASHMVPSIGEYVEVSEVPTPEWREMGNGRWTARLTFQSDGAAAWRVNFRSLNLVPGEELYVSGVDATGAVQAMHGPYREHGPLNLPMFQTAVVQGASVVIEVRAARTGEWPFSLGGVERLTANRLQELVNGGLEVKARVRPQAFQKPKGEKRTAWIGDELVPFEVIDGRAIRGGDMVLGTVEEVTAGKAGRDSHVTTSRYWPAGVVPYTIQYASSGIVAGSELDNNVKAAIAYWNSVFPGILKPRTTESSYVTFRYANLVGYCESALGFQGGQQFISMPQGCDQYSIAHEIGHALGLVHEHTRPDRGHYVTILWDNIIDGREHNFEYSEAGTTKSVGDYDFFSLMHYPLNSFAIDPKKDTIRPFERPAYLVGGTVLSPKDVVAVRNVYCGLQSAWAMPATIAMDAEGGNNGFAFSGPPYCAWTMVAQYPWIKITNATTTGSGAGYARFTVMPNSSRYPRSGSIKIGARAAVIRQEGTAEVGK